MWQLRVLQNHTPTLVGLTLPLCSVAGADPVCFSRFFWYFLNGKGITCWWRRRGTDGSRVSSLSTALLIYISISRIDSHHICLILYCCRADGDERWCSSGKSEGINNEGVGLSFFLTSSSEVLQFPRMNVAKRIISFVLKFAMEGGGVVVFLYCSQLDFLQFRLADWWRLSGPVLEPSPGHYYQEDDGAQDDWACDDSDQDIKPNWISFPLVVALNWLKLEVLMSLGQSPWLLQQLKMQRGSLQFSLTCCQDWSIRCYYIVKLIGVLIRWDEQTKSS